MKDDEGRVRDRNAPPRPERPGPDPRLLGLGAIVLVVALALLLAHIMHAVSGADLCLASGGRGC